MSQLHACAPDWAAVYVISSCCLLAVRQAVSAAEEADGVSDAIPITVKRWRVCSTPSPVTVTQSPVRPERAPFIALASENN